MSLSREAATVAAMFLLSFSLILFELVLTRLFGVVVFASFAHLALGLALLGISAGAIAQHVRPSLVPEEGLEERLGWLALLQGVATFVAVLAVLYFPITQQFLEAPEHYGERSSIPHKLVNYGWFSALLPVLTVPFAVAGLAFAGVFQRRKADIGRLYGADLIGGAAGAVLFVPILWLLPGPDTAFLVFALTSLCAALLWKSVGRDGLATLAGGLTALFFAISLSTLVGVEYLKVQFSAGYSEENITFVQWTPLTRLAIHEDERGKYMLLDNSSASHIVLDEKEREEKVHEPNRSLIYRFHEPPARIAILAASAGPEVAVAQHLGHSGIDAVDIAAIGRIVRERYPDSAVNPYTHGDTNPIEYDGRAAILHAEHPYDIIQMVHANLHSSAGLMANAWSPSLLETREAFETYFDRLSDDGTLSFGRGSKTRAIYRSAWDALKARGVEDPATHIVYIEGPATLMLAKKRAWTPAEMDRLRKIMKEHYSDKQVIVIDPLNPDRRRIQQYLDKYSPITDNHPYMDDPATVLHYFGRSVKILTGGLEEEISPSEVIYHTLAVQILFVLLAGVALVVLPVLTLGGSGLSELKGVGWGLLYVSCLGYGYLAVETVLIHELVLFVGHPTYALTVVILAMLLFSGLGSVAVERVAPERLTATLQRVLVVVLVLGALQAWVFPPVLYALFLGLPIVARAAITMAVLMPLGFVMGMPFPLAMRILKPEASGMVP
ncbi:MAG: hypothetical protein H6734_25695, partial [Alphaproteobacteria bacterium]|nr:hypothetical protein [Alphaproteobacteria bacterium]